MTTAERMHGHGPIADVPPGFVDAVMRSVAVAPLPSPTRAFTSALQDRSTSEAHGALSVAWRLIRAGATMPVLVRAQALALLLFVGGSVVGGSAIAAVATYQTVAPIVRSVVDPSADDGGIPIPALAEPSPEPTSSPSPTPIPAVAPPDDADVANPSEPTSEDGDTDDEPGDDPGDDADDLDSDDLDSDAETGEHDENGGATEDDPDEESGAHDGESGGGAEEASAETDDDGPEDAEPNDPDDAEPDDPDHTEPSDTDATETDDPEDAESDDPDRDD